MKLASFNVNSIRIRLPAVAGFLDQQQPDVLVLQELKADKTHLDWTEITARGYHVHAVGQAAYNGVAIISKKPATLRHESLPDAPDGQARYLEIALDSGAIIAGIYAPNGNPVLNDASALSDKFIYKCRWYDCLLKHLRTSLLPLRRPLAILGDFNIAAARRDIFTRDLTDDDATTHHLARRYYHSLINLGLTDSWAALHSDAVGYTYWDYKAGRWDRDEGMRIDLILLDGHLADRLEHCEVDRVTRSQPRPSDHAPLWVSLSEAAAAPSRSK